MFNTALNNFRKFYLSKPLVLAAVLALMLVVVLFAIFIPKQQEEKPPSQEEKEETSEGTNLNYTVYGRITSVDNAKKVFVLETLEPNKKTYSVEVTSTTDLSQGYTQNFETKEDGTTTAVANQEAGKKLAFSDLKKDNLVNLLSKEDPGKETNLEAVLLVVMQ